MVKIFVLASFKNIDYSILYEQKEQHMNITGRQIRAARGLLGWKMEELADKAGLTRITIRQTKHFYCI